MTASPLQPDPPIKPHPYSPALASFLFKRHRILNVLGVYDTAEFVTRERLAEPAKTLKLVLEGRASL